MDNQRMKKSGGERLAEYRDRHKYNQRDLAELLEIPEANLSRLINGVRYPGLPTAIRIEQVTGIPVESWLENRVGKIDRRRKEHRTSEQCFQVTK